MDNNSRVPQPRPAVEELPGGLRQAVEQVLSEAVPAASAARAVDRARQLAGPVRFPRLKWAALLAVAMPAAAALLAAVLWPDPSLIETRGFRLPVKGDGGPALADAAPRFGVFQDRTTQDDDDAGGQPRPGLGPILDLRRGANTPGINYFLGTEPEGERSGKGKKTPAGASDEPPIRFPPAKALRAKSRIGVRTGNRDSFLRPAEPDEPMQDSNIATSGGPGQVDAKAYKETMKKWGEMSEEQRQAFQSRLTNRMSQKHREAIKNYFKRIEAKQKRGNFHGRSGATKAGKPKGPGRGAGQGKPAEKEDNALDALQDTDRVEEDEDEDEKGKSKARKDTGGEKPARKAQTWRQERREPTFARVYLGNGNSLDLVSLQVTVTVEGGRSRTVVDHIFRNPHNKRLEGTFEYPLPSGASPSYFAMFLGQTRDTVPPRFGRNGDAPRLPDEALARLTPEQLVKQVNTTDWGTLQQARVVSRQKALESYEEIVRGQIDPALLEYASGNTFRGRVFPIPPKGYNRILIAYEELLPSVGERVLYRFPLPNCKLNEMQFTLQASAADCKGARKTNDGRLVYTRKWRNEEPRGTLAFSFVPANPRIQVSSGRHDDNGPVYLYARIRPDLKAVENSKPFAGHAVFLLDTSLSENAGRFDDSIKLMRKILESDSAIKRFNVLTFNVGCAWLNEKGWLDNTSAGRKQALAKLDGTLLEGATDISAALDALARPAFDVPAKMPVNVFVLSDGQITWGESDVKTLAARFEAECKFAPRFHCYRTGLGAENLELFQALTRRGGGIFNCFTKAQMADAARAHRRQCLTVERVRLVGGPASSDLLLAGRQAAVFPGGELVVAAKLKKSGRTTLLVLGTFLGKKYVREYAIEARGTGELAPRGWAEVAVAALLSLNDPKLDGLVTAYCQKFGIASRVASFLVLESDNDYKRFNLDAERGKTVQGDLARFLEDMWKNMGKVISAREEFQRFLAKLGPRVKLLEGPTGQHVKKLLARLVDTDYELSHKAMRGAIIPRGKADKKYLAARNQDHRNADVYLSEAQRRAEAGDVDGAIRVLSSVIEVFPGRDDALRLVGYRLLDLKQPAQAVRLFQRVQGQRPFEPHSYRDLARSLEEGGKYGLAALQYEILLAGEWHARFGGSLKQVGEEEYAHMMQEAIARKAVSKELANVFGERLERMASARYRGDLRVTISWNTDATDVDLWVIEPDGTKCFYQNTRTPSGGELSQDQTQGYGPERYQISKAKPGVYRVIVHYFRANPNLLAGETHVNVVITRHAGSKDEKIERRTITLKTGNQEVEVFKVEF